jgi:hypothetical protein
MPKQANYLSRSEWWTTVFSGILAVTALAALWYARGQVTEAREESEKQLQASHEQTQIQHLLTLVSEFDQNPMATYRRSLAIERTLHPNRDADPYEMYRELDFFETVGLLVERGYLTESDVFDQFRWWIFNLNADPEVQDGITSVRSNDSNEYADFTLLVTRLERIDAERHGTHAHPSLKEIMAFYDEESHIFDGAAEKGRLPDADSVARAHSGQQPIESKPIETHAQTSQHATQPLSTFKGQREDVDMQDKLARYTKWLVIVGTVQFIALIGQGIVFWLTLSQMRNTGERQLRAYVVTELGTIGNIANPVPLYPGQVIIPTGAEITNQGCGPVARIQIKNTGQTPAYQVVHWGNICISAHPLVGALPGPLPGYRPTAVLGPGIISTKMFFLNPALTAQQIADLRAGLVAIYVYGEIAYVDAFAQPQTTRYRFIYHPMGGAIGVSTDLSFCEEGNEAT